MKLFSSASEIRRLYGMKNMPSGTGRFTSYMGRTAHAASAMVDKEVRNAERCAQDMREHRAALRMMGEKHTRGFAAALENVRPVAKALNRCVAQDPSTAALRSHVQERIELACAKGETSVARYIEALLLETPVALCLHPSVFDALIDIHEGAGHARLKAMRP